MLNPKSKIQNLKSRRRRGVTIVEVLFAILVATVGIFSVIVIFPFASSQAKRARVNDILAVGGRGAFHDFDSRGMRRPDRWLAFNPVTRLFVTAVVAPREAICIDPRTIAAHTSYNNGNQTLQQNTNASGQPGGQCVEVFPYVQAGTTPYVTNGPPQVYTGQYMRRLTLWDGIPGTLRANGLKWGMSMAQANSIFLIDDDIAYQRNQQDKSLPATQEALIVNSNVPSNNRWLKRDSERKISWIATLVPLLDAPSLALGQRTDEYVLSVVMMYERANDLDNLDFRKERMVKGALLGGGATGGELYLTNDSNDINADRLRIKNNEWVMVSGTYDTKILGQGNGPFVTRFQWYRVSECDHEIVANTTINPPVFQLSATLMGQDWNMNFVDLNPPAAVTAAIAPGGVAAGGVPVNVTIVEGAFAVFEKTVRLEYGSSM